MTPSTTAPSSKAFSSSSRYAPDGFLARQLGLAETVFNGIKRNLDFVTNGDFVFILKLVLGMTASDLRPALTMTTSSFTATTVPVMIEPGFIC